MEVGKKYDLIERVNSNDVKFIGCDKSNTSFLRISHYIPYLGIRDGLYYEFDDFGNKFFKTIDEIREDKINCIIYI
jgi:hypothetical protein